MTKKDPLIDERSQKILQQDLLEMKDPVMLILFTSTTENKPFNEFSSRLLTELSGLTDKLKVTIEEIGGPLSQKFGITRTPTLLIAPDKFKITLLGAPAGEETRVFLLALIMASTGVTILSPASKMRLTALSEARNIKIFVSPTCPYCPAQTALAIAAAIELPNIVSTEIIEIYENRDLAVQFNALSVPQTFVNDTLVGSGLQPEELFVEEVVSAARGQASFRGDTERKERDLLIIGAGPAGLTAAIYAERGGIKTVVLERSNIGGQVAITPVVENYPGFTTVAGKTLMDIMAQQALSYADIHEGEEVLSIIRTDAGFEATSSRSVYSVKAILITAGAESKKLGIPGEELFQGRGVSYCATCDGYFFRDSRKVLVVGGGNTAATDALYLKNIGADVTLVHRRGELRAEQFLQQELKNSGIPILYNSELREVRGDKKLDRAIIEDTREKHAIELAVEGVFIAIGYMPANQIAVSLGVAIDGEGYILVDGRQRTSVAGVYAAGDITGGLKQIVTAVSQGAVAAMTIFEDLANPYWKTGRK